MATTSVTYNGDGATTDFAIGFTYTSRTFVKAYVGGVITTAWTFLNSTTIRFTVAPPVGTGNIEIRRVTSTTPLVDFVGAATITDTDLDLATLQMLHVLEENQNNSLVGMQQSGGNWDATSDRIVNVADPLAVTDAATKNYVDSVIGSVADAEAEADAAALSAADALAQAGAAAASAVAADASADAAAVSAASISSVLPVSGMTATYIPVVSGATAYTNRRLKYHRYIGSGALSGTSLGLALSGYNEYLLELIDFNPLADDDLELQFATDGVPTYITANYAYVLEAKNTNGGTANSANGEAASSIRIANAIESSRISRLCQVRILPGDGGSNRNSIESLTLHQDSGVTGAAGVRAARARCFGEYHAATTAATHVRLKWNGGTTFNNGSYYLWGIVA